MIYKYYKYNNISDFIIGKHKNIQEQYTIINLCDGIISDSERFNDKCFGCLFCYFCKSEIQFNFNNFFGKEFIKNFAEKAFHLEKIKMPTSKGVIKKIKNLEDFTSKDETKKIQPWATLLVNKICSTKNEVSMEVPILVQSQRYGRLDVCALTDDKQLLVMESKINLDDALRDERFVEQQKKYVEEIKTHTSNFLYLTIFGGNETDLLPCDNEYCTGVIGNKSKRFYDLIKGNNIKFISANALWLLACKFISYGEEYSWNIFLPKIFNNSSTLGLVSLGLIQNINGRIQIIKI